jgi:hypothetical protein
MTLIPVHGVLGVLHQVSKFLSESLRRLFNLPHKVHKLSLVGVRDGGHALSKRSQRFLSLSFS